MSDLKWKTLDELKSARAGSQERLKWINHYIEQKERARAVLNERITSQVAQGREDKDSVFALRYAWDAKCATAKRELKVGSYWKHNNSDNIVKVLSLPEHNRVEMETRGVATLTSLYSFVKHYTPCKEGDMIKVGQAWHHKDSKEIVAVKCVGEKAVFLVRDKSDGHEFLVPFNIFHEYYILGFPAPPKTEQPLISVLDIARIVVANRGITPIQILVMLCDSLGIARDERNDAVKRAAVMEGTSK